MRPHLPLEQMSTEDKLWAMDAIWDSLIDQQETPESPDWHGEVLAERRSGVERGELGFEDWEVLREQIYRELE